MEKEADEKLTTDQGPSVIQIQTPFGGGKTHALVAIYHYGARRAGHAGEGGFLCLPADRYAHSSNVATT